MALDLSTSIALIRDLVGFPTVSRDPNRDLLLYVERYLASHGVTSDILWAPGGEKGNLWATIGPANARGVILSGHSDVVPVDGQAWSSDPFTLREADGKLYGRGTADMKGFLGIVLAAVPEMLRRPLRAPVHIAISYDEELGCLGVRSLVERLAAMPLKPALCIVGEPTLMQVIIAHKGGRSYRVHLTGRPAHSSLAPHAVNAIEAGAELVLFLRDIARGWAAEGPFDGAFDVSHSTLSTGLIDGGTAINIVPEHCRVTFEFRHLASVDAEDVTRRIKAFATETLLPAMRAIAPEADIVFEPLYEYPGLDIAPEHPAVTFVKQLVGRNDHAKVAYGTEAGLFQGRAGVASVVCGPGSIGEAHKADEFLAISELEACQRMIARLLDRLEKGEPLTMDAPDT
ncbi:MAG: acetylornithine deacetylase [Hyphomicrobiaceae bacterium]